MGGYRHFLPTECQNGECDIDVFRELYCSKHTGGKGVHQPAMVSTPTATTTTMAPPDEKLGDAITVKPPLPSLTSPKEKNEKKQLPNKKTARKTTTSSKPKKSPSISRISDFHSSFDRTSANNANSSDQLPPKKPRLFDDVSEWGLASRHSRSSFEERIPDLSSGFRPMKTEECDLSSAASDFALRPSKENPKSLGIPPKPKPREDQTFPSFKSSHNPQVPPKQDSKKNARIWAIPTHGVIDLTQDDEPRPRPASSGRQGLQTDIHKVRERPTTEPHHRVGHVISNLPHEGKFIEVQTLNGGKAKSGGSVDVSNGNEQHNSRKPDTNLKTHPPPKDIPPRPVKTVLPTDPQPSPQLSQPKFNNEKQSAPQQHQNFPQLSEKPANVSRPDGSLNSTQIQQPVPQKGSTRPMALSHSIDAHNPPKSTTPDLSSMPNKPSTNKHRIESAFTSGAQTDTDVRKIIEDSQPVHLTRIIDTPREGQVNRLDTLLLQQEAADTASRTHRSQSKESSLSKTQSISETQEADSHTPSASSQNAMLITPPFIESANGADIHKTEKLVSVPVGEPSLGALIREQSWKCSKPEEKRQILVSKHDPEKFDSYIYSKSNEPFRPGSALFGLPPWMQPTRPTRPATHFAHIDPRIHWSHPRSEKWHMKKQKEIRARGTRKDNFGKVAARAARRKREEGCHMPPLPDRVKNNPQWLAAVEELDEMAEEYHAQKREKLRERKLRKERWSYPRSVQHEETEIEKESNPVDEDGDCEMGDDHLDESSVTKTPTPNGWSHAQAAQA
ncbi:hypothetical protein F5B19DRAFT_406325 [Rostrohypoxylon terebratum]|nr:hypothetical protein F5B19DRAFT_406325 [Rostrohypoxylon terebratum]